MNLLGYKKFYLIGIKGVGMTMLAQFLHEKGKIVSGSDIADTFMTDAVLRSRKIKVFTGFKAEQIPAGSVIIYSSAYNQQNNVELSYIYQHQKKFAKQIILNYAQAIGALFNSYQGIAVCGSHGKTTTTAWLGFVLRDLGLEPNVVAGARVPQFKGSSMIGNSPYFIAEADEYQNKLQYFQPYGVVLNNIDFDHPDYFKNKTAYFRVFQNFVEKIPPAGFLVANASDQQVQKLLTSTKAHIISYALADKLTGKNNALSLLGHSVRYEKGWQYFQVNDWGEFKIRLYGRHNLENALAVLASALALGIEPMAAKKSLAKFTGTARRAELLGEYQHIPIFDDYAHHPTEIKATLQAFKEVYPNKRLVLVFHPHTFSRTKSLFADFVTSFAQADVLALMEIYASAREKQGGVSSLDLIEA
ncbi:UDP-N-acetylmuramate--L-alanine ligase, partial [Patescibacteria group bacterium]|nr:UDP-N-acetylmuramate--L-alanine ligase [Patescibacteria group bacterium]